MPNLFKDDQEEKKPNFTAKPASPSRGGSSNVGHKMKLLLLSLVVGLMCGCATDRLGSDARLRRLQSTWLKETEGRYDTVALRDFLSEIVARQKQFSGVDLAAVRRGDRWKPNGSSLTCGDWLFVTGEKEDEFILYDATDHPRAEFAVGVKCQRISRSSFRALEFYEDRLIFRRS